MSLLPWDFWRLTIAEFTLMLHGHARSMRKNLEREAGWVATLINHYPMRGKGAKAVRIEQLIGMDPDELAKLKRARDRHRQELLESRKRQHG